MIKEKIFEILDLNKELIKGTFGINDNGIDNIRKFLTKDYNSFQDIADNLFSSEMENREKITLSYLIGYANGRIKK